MNYKNVFIVFSLLCMVISSCKKKEDDKTPTVPVNKIMFVKSSAGVNLRKLPDANSEIIEVIPQGKDLYVIEEKTITDKVGNAEGKWQKIKAWPSDGWVFSTLLGEGKYSQDFFLGCSLGDNIRGYVIDYNTHYIQNLVQSMFKDNIPENKVIDIDVNTFNPAIPVKTGDKVTLITKAGVIKEDIVKSVHLVISDESSYLAYRLTNNDEKESVCVKSSYLSRNGATLSLVEKILVTGERADKIHIKTVQAIIKSEGITAYNPMDKKIQDEYKKNPATYIESHYDIQVFACDTPGREYSLVLVINKNKDEDYYNSSFVFNGEKIIYGNHSTPDMFFSINNKLYMLALEWLPHSGYSDYFIAELDNDTKLIVDYSSGD